MRNGKSETMSRNSSRNLRKVAREAIARHRERCAPHNLLVLRMKYKPRVQQHQVWPATGPHSLQTLLADRYIGGVYV